MPCTEGVRQPCSTDGQQPGLPHSFMVAHPYSQIRISTCAHEAFLEQLPELRRHLLQGELQGGHAVVVAEVRSCYCRNGGTLQHAETVASF